MHENVETIREKIFINSKGLFINSAIFQFYLRNNETFVVEEINQWGSVVHNVQKYCLWNIKIVKKYNEDKTV